MAIKPKSSSVKIEEFSAALCYIFYRLEEYHRMKMSLMPENLVITSINDGIHKPDSKHYKNQAIDVRSKNFKNEEAKFEFCSKFQKFLGPRFSILYEYPGQVNEHFHIQVKKGEVYP